MNRQTRPRKRVGVLISGRGSNMRALVAAAAAPEYPAEIVLVAADRQDADGLVSARQGGISAVALDRSHYQDGTHFEGQLDSLLKSSRVDLIALAGFMRLLTPSFVDAWRDRIINIHPSLLPAFKGLNTHRRALEAGVKIAGCSVHFVRAEMDTGPIIAQAAVPVLPGDTPENLAARVLAAEHRIYPQALALVASGLATIEGEVVQINHEINQTEPLFSPGLPQNYT